MRKVYKYNGIEVACQRPVAGRRESTVDEHVEIAAEYAARLFDKPRARAPRRAVALGYWRGVPGLHLRVDGPWFARAVDELSYETLTGRNPRSANEPEGEENA